MIRTSIRSLSLLISTQTYQLEEMYGGKVFKQSAQYWAVGWKKRNIGLTQRIIQYEISYTVNVMQIHYTHQSTQFQ